MKKSQKKAEPSEVASNNEWYGFKVSSNSMNNPLMVEEEFQSFKEDVRVNGLLEYPLVYKDEIVDGRHAVRALVELGRKVVGYDWKTVRKDCPGIELEDYLISKNSCRRQIKPDQKVASIVLIKADALKTEAAERMAAGRPKKDTSTTKKVSTNVDTLEDGKKEAGTTEQIIAERYTLQLSKVRQALKLNKYDPAKLRDVLNGKISLLKAFRETFPTEDAQMRAVKDFSAEPAKREQLRVKACSIAKSLEPEDRSFLVRSIIDDAQPLVFKDKADMEDFKQKLVSYVDKVARFLTPSSPIKKSPASKSSAIARPIEDIQTDV